MTVYKEWILENQHAVNGLLEQELDYWLSQVDADLSPKGRGVAYSTTIQVPVDLGKAHVDIQNNVLAAMLFALYKVSDGSVYVVFREGHGRNPLNKYDVSDAIGWFTCKYPTKYSVVEDSLMRTLEAIAAGNQAVPNGGVGFDVLKYFGPSYISRQLECPANILFNYLGDLTFTGKNAFKEDGTQLMVAAHSGFSSTIEQQGNAGGPGLFGLNVNAWMENGDLYCRLDIADSLGLDATACHRFVEGVQAYIKELVSPAAPTAAPTPTRSRVIPFQKGLISYVFNHPESDNYINQNVFETDLEISFDFFQTVCRTLTTKYEILRTCYDFDYSTGDFTATVLSPDVLNCDHFTLPVHGGPGELNQLLATIKYRKFKINSEPLIRFSLIQTDSQKTFIVITSHHIIIDGTSVVYLLNELMNIAADLRAGKSPGMAALQFSAYADWVNEKDEEEAIGYWKKLLTETTPALLEHSTVGEARSDPNLFHDAAHHFSVDPLTASVLKGQHITIAAALNYVVGWVMARYIGKDSFIWGNTVALRPFDLDGMETIVGPCIATIPVTADFHKEGNVLEGIKALQLQLLESREHAYLTLNDIARAAGQTQLFSVSYVYQNFAKPELDSQQSLSYKLHFSADSNISAHFPINILVFEENEILYIRASYRADSFTRELIRDICHAISTLFNQLHRLKDLPIADIDLLSVCGCRASFLQGAANDLSAITLHDAFIRAVMANPQHIAVIDKTSRLSYAELHARSNRIASLLLEQDISGPVGLRMKRSVDMISVIIGILQAGCTVVSLEHDFPDTKIEWIDQHVGLSAILTDEAINFKVAARIFIVDGIDPLYDRIALPTVLPSSLCCINYTSGSTGVPKLVKISHTGHVNRVLWLGRTVPATPGDVYGFKTLLCFGPSLREVFEPLMQGSSLYVYSNASNNNPELFYTETTQHRVTRLFLTPTFIRLLYDCGLPDALSTLRYLEISGEPIPVELYKKLRNDFPSAMVVGRYGATEAPGTVYYTQKETNASRHLPLGVPIDNTGVAVMNDRGDILPVGIIGEVAISGESISTGYINKELETGNFMELAGKRYVKTGDLGYIDPMGMLVFQSRKTRMVKIKGYRVEPAEIEYNLLQHAAIKKAVAVPLVTKNNARITVFYIPQDTVAAGELRSFLEQRLPPYMVPHEFIAIDKLPLTDSGKVDYVRLAEQAVRNNRSGTRPPAPGIEQTVFETIADLVGHQEFDVFSNLLEIGVDSILSLKAIYRLRKTFDVNIVVTDIYMHPTVNEFSSLLAQKIDHTEEEAYYFVNYKEDNKFLFFIPPIGNSRLDLKKLESALPEDVTLIIFKAIRTEQCDSTRLETIAAAYIDQIDLINKGKYINISGWSLGATIVYEMAAQLERQGAAIGSILLFDPGFYSPGYDDELTKEKLTNILQEQYSTEVREQVLTDMLKANQLIMQYRPSTCSGPLQLFKPTDIGKEERNHDRQWNGLEQYCTGEIQVTNLPGNHMTMLNDVTRNHEIITRFVK